MRSSGLQRLIDSTVPLEPGDVSPLGMFRDVMEKLHRLGLIARFARIILRDDSLNFDRYHKIAGSNQPRPGHSLARNPHC
jgi:hypothetical protein